MNDRTLKFAKFILEGSHYDIGKSIGKVLPQYEELYKINVMDENTDRQTIMQKRKLIDEFCPGVYDELSGIADGLNLPIERLAALSDYSIVGGCSQFVALPKITHNGHILVVEATNFQ